MLKLQSTNKENLKRQLFPLKLERINDTNPLRPYFYYSSIKFVYIMAKKWWNNVYFLGLKKFVAFYNSKISQEKLESSHLKLKIYLDTKISFVALFLRHI